MSWPPVANAHSDVPIIRTTFHHKPRTSAFLDPLVGNEIDLASRTTDVSPPSCPLSRTSSATQSVDRGSSDSTASDTSHLFHACHDFTTSCHLCVFCIRFERIFGFYCYTTHVATSTRQVTQLTPTPFQHRIDQHRPSCLTRGYPFQARVSTTQTPCTLAMEHGTHSGIHSCCRTCKA
jgi:hypothetical protein